MSRPCFRRKSCQVEKYRFITFRDYRGGNKILSSIEKAPWSRFYEGFHDGI